MVAGLVGVMRSLNPDLEADEIYDILKSTGRSTSAEGTIGVMIDAEKAIQAAMNG